MALTPFDGSIELKNGEGEILIEISFKFNDDIPQEAQAGFVGQVGMIIQANMSNEEFPED